MPKNNVSAYHTGPMASSCTCRAQTPVSEALSQTLPTTYLTFLTDKLRAKPFRVKFGGHNIIGFYATALEGAVAYRGSAGAVPKPAGRTPGAAVAESSTKRREQVWDSDVGEFVDARTGAVWKLDAKQQARQEAPVRLRSESEATSLKGSKRD